jgi:hypothetical protein
MGATNGSNGADGARFGLSDTQVFTDLALERGYVSREQVDECIGIREKIRALGLEEKLPDIMVKKGYLAEADARRLEKALSGFRKLGNFEIVARIGQGSMGSVFKARQVSMDRFVALKILPPRLAKDPAYVERFLREARAVAKLNHVNIVQGIDVGEAGGYYYFAMEYVEGVTVRETLKSKGPYAEKAALEIIVQITRALDHAAKAGLVHRDIKPDNVIVTPAGVAKLLDLGIAKAMDTTDESGQRVGTPYYISPEQARGDANVDARSDIYSLGATLYHMVVGSPPFSGSSPEEIIRAHLTATVPNPREVRPGLSRNISRLIETMMAREAEERYQSAAELLGDLDKVMRGRPPSLGRATRMADAIAPGMEGGGTARTAPVASVGKRRSPAVIAAMVALALVVAAGIALLMVLREKPVKPTPLPVPQPPVVNVPTPTPTPTPGTDARSLAAKEMLDYALKKAAENPNDHEGNIARLEKVVADTKGTAANLEAQAEIERLKVQLNAAIQKKWDAAWLAAEGKAKERRFVDAVSALNAGFPDGYRQKYPAWAGSYGQAVKKLEEQAAQWVDGEEKRAADLVAKGDFAKAREVVKAVSVAGTPGLNERIAGALAGIDKAEADYKKHQDDQAVKQQEELRRQRELAYGKFLRELYGKEAGGDFDAAEGYCRTASGRPEFAAAKEDIQAEIKDLGEMRKAAADILVTLGAVRGSIRFTWNRQPMSARVLEFKDGRVWVSPGEGAEFPVTPTEMVASEVVEITGFGRNSPANAALYLTWRGDYPAARKFVEALTAGPSRDRNARRLDMLEHGLADFYADELIGKARAAHGTRNFAEFGRLMAELRAKYAMTKGFTAARGQLERLELDVALGGLDPAMLSLGRTRVAAGGLGFAYDFAVDSAQVLDWRSSGDMWRWGQTIFDRNGVDVFLTDDSRLMLRPAGDGRLAASWAVPVDKLASAEFDVVWTNGHGSLGVGLVKTDLFGKDGNLRVWFPENGKPYIRQGDQRKQAAAEAQLEKNRKYRVRLEIAGNDVRLFLDGKELVSDTLTFNPAGSRLTLGAVGTEASFGAMQIVCQPDDAWLKRRVDLAARFRQADVKPGLLVDYFSDAAMTKKVISRMEPAAYAWWSLRAPAPGVPADNFGARFSGKLLVEKAGKYRLHLRADDDGKLLIDGKKVIEGRHNGSGEADLSAGFHDIVMTVADTGGAWAGTELSWETDGLERQVIPYELLGH